jgi:hypothetical protein
MVAMASAAHVETPAIPSWAVRLLLLTAAALVPWTTWLFLNLPRRHVAHHWDLAWTGFDVAIAATLAVTAFGLARRPALVPTSATVAATLLVCDAWFDTTTAGDDTQLWVALLLAFGVELPLAVICIWLARRSRTVR